MMGIYRSTALKVYPSFQQYDDTAEFTSLICTDDDGISGDDVEWLSPNFTFLMSSPDYRICGRYKHIIIKFKIVISADNFYVSYRTSYSELIGLSHC